MISFRFTLSCHAIALASAEALYERPIKREAKLAQFLLLNWYFLLRTFFGLRFLRIEERLKLLFRFNA